MKSYVIPFVLDAQIHEICVSDCIHGGHQDVLDLLGP